MTTHELPAINELDRPCSAPLDRLALPDGYTHYPYDDEDMIELLEDLTIAANLSKTEAARTLGFAATGAWANCENYWRIIGTLDRQWIDEWGKINLKGSTRQAYELGVQDADKELQS